MIVFSKGMNTGKTRIFTEYCLGLIMKRSWYKFLNLKVYRRDAEGAKKDLMNNGIYEVFEALTECFKNPCDPCQKNSEDLCCLSVLLS
jgi:RAB protein geranylgeranyltransferase component A